MYQVTTTYYCPTCGSSNIEQGAADPDNLFECECGEVFDVADANCKATIFSTEIEGE